MITNNQIPKLFDETLEQRLITVFNELHIEGQNKEGVEEFLRSLKEKDQVKQYHYQHSIKVALVAREIGRYMHLDERALFYAGLLHDVGKSAVPLECLAKADFRLTTDCTWTEEDAKLMEVHVTEGHNQLRKRFGFTADIIVRHHRYQRNLYPKELPAFTQEYSEGTKVLIGFYSRLIALADVYDAFHRVNKKFDTLKVNTSDEIKGLMLQTNSDLNFLVDSLYDSRIFGRENANN